MRRLLIVLAAVALLAGCGGGGETKSSGGSGEPSGPPLTKIAYQAKLQAISKEIGAGISGSTFNDTITKTEVDKLVKAFHEFADRLREVNPPAAVKKLHAQLITAMNDLADEFPDLAKKLNSLKDKTKAFGVLLGTRAVQELAKVGQAFQKAGYKLNLNGS